MAMRRYFVQRLRDDRWVHHRACKTIAQAKESVAWIERSGRKARFLTAEQMFSDKSPDEIVPPEPSPSGKPGEN